MAGAGTPGEFKSQHLSDRNAVALRIAESETFRRSNRLRGMLLYLCNRAFSGHPEELTEQQIGVAVFGRPVAYDSANDNVVRVAARQLRIKLQEYYSTEGRSDEEMLVIPRGTYVPEVVARGQGAALKDHGAKTDETLAGRTPPPPRRDPWRWIAATASLAALAAIGAAIWSYRERRDLKLEQQPVRANENLVKALTLIPGQRTLAIVGDPNLAAFRKRTGTEVNLESYLEGRTPGSAGGKDLREGEKHEWSRLRSMPQVDTAAVAALARIFQANPADSALIAVQHASEVRGPDFRAANVILIGDPIANPWMDLVLPALNFQIFYDSVKKVVAIRNREPKAEEPAQFSGAESAGRGLGFAHVAARPNVSRGGMVLLLAGTTAGAVMAAVDFACNREAVPRLNSLLGIDNFQQTEGFELVLRVDSLAGISREVQIVAHRTTLRARP